jgi:hypothetical protein
VKKVIQAHDGNILVLFCYGGFVWSGGSDNIVRIWNSKVSVQWHLKRKFFFIDNKGRERERKKFVRFANVTMN